MQEKFAQLFRKKKFDFSVRSAIFSITMLFFQIFLGYLIYISGGTQSVLPQLMSITVTIAGLWYGVDAGVFFGITGGIILGPLIPLDTTQGIPQEELNWLIRMVFLISTGGIIGLFKSNIVDFFEERELLLKTDQFSSLPNRDAFTQYINESVEINEPFSVAMVEIRNQRKIVSVLGFQFFQDILNQVIAEIRRIAPTCSLYAIQIDTLVVISCDDIDIIAKQIASYFSQPLAIRGIPILCEIAIGIVYYPKNGTTATGLIETAFLTLDQVRASNRLIGLAPDPKVIGISPLELVSKLDQALEDGQIDFEYQPIVDSRTGKTAFLEALIRWNHPKYGIISPLKFINFLESTNLINKLTYWSIQRNASRMMFFEGLGIDLRISINISPSNLQQENFVDEVESIIRNAGISADRFCFEITERGLITEYDQIIENLVRLKGLGIYLSLDDFGTGNTSLSSFSKILLHNIKLDRFFIQDLNFNDINVEILKGIKQIANNINIKVVAEGIETQSVLDVLNDIGVDYFQGYYIARPMNFSAIKTWLRANK
jgi:EAL domain-containing protein (putative c-di-GMP-specific phosphodiesterase class I)/GGDEF domain-containing protein